ncbi:MAG: c-type cytochrome, partial [Solirubrobacterales bacterium]|nr:c-type cytochrome [Solirubrobacterales bacterium]
MPGALALLALGGCAVKHPTGNLVRGKQLFVAKCAACHTLSHAA